MRHPSLGPLGVYVSRTTVEVVVVPDVVAGEAETMGRLSQHIEEVLGNVKKRRHLKSR